MVLATSISSRRHSAASSPRETMEVHSGEEADTMALHDRLVAYVHAIDNPFDGKSDVWVEHSYALSGRGAGGAREAAGCVRVLLGARAEPADDSDVDVDGAPPPPPSPPPADTPPDSDDGADADDADADADDDDDAWEARLTALAPHAEHARLAGVAVDCLRRVRLAKLAGGRFAERASIAEQARRLRLALAPLWLSAAQRPAPWLHAALFACAPPATRRRFERIERALRRLVPRLADRLTGAKGPTAQTPTTIDRPREASVGPEAGPWLVWVGGGRWARLLRPLVHTRTLPLSAAAQPPDAWCASVAGAVRTAFADILAEAGGRSVVVGGCGGGAALAGALGGAGGARGALLLAPALQTAEGPREGRGRLARGPALLVAGSRAACGWRGALVEALGARQRLLLVRGADDALRLPAATRRRYRLTQRALDAAVVEECVRWIHETCEEPEEEPDDDVQYIKTGASAGTESSEEEYAHLPAAAAPLAVPPLAPIAPHSAGSETRSIEIVEGRVVSRVSGGTPLALLPPRRDTRERRAERRVEPRAERRAERRAEPRAEPAPVPLAAADIMQLPIVFADDERTVAPQPEVPASEGAVTVTSGVGRARRGPVRYTRVIVAKRAAPAPAPAPAAAPAPPRPPLLVRRGLRLVPRSAD